MALLLQILISAFVPMPKGATFGDWTMMHAVVGMKPQLGNSSRRGFDISMHSISDTLLFKIEQRNVQLFQGILFT